jgi:hypothetical protein
MRVITQSKGCNFFKNGNDTYSYLRASFSDAEYIRLSLMAVKLFT